MKPRIALFFTGGTISMRIDPATGGAIPMLSGAEILAQVPGIETLAEIETIDFARLPGPHWTPERILQLAQAVQVKLADETIDSVVITHGTDTLEETAYALDLLLASDKPVVFVGAMRNSSELSFDGPANLKAAVRVAASTEARELGVLVVMNEELIAASEVTKTHTEKTDTFQSRDFGSLGIVDKDHVIVARWPARREHIATDGIESRVEIVKIYAGADGKFIDFAVREGTRGLVIEALGRGNVTPLALAAIKRAIEQGVPVVITSRCPRGRVLDTYAYEGGGKQLTQAGAILGGLLPSHKARVKLMLALGAGWPLEKIRAAFMA